MFQVLSHFERCPGFDKKRYVKKIAGGVLCGASLAGQNHRIYVDGLGQMTKMAAKPIYMVKTFKKDFPTELIVL